MFIHNLFHLHMLWETPEAGGGAPVAVQPGAQPSQGQGAGQGDFWAMFPNVPEDQRATLEPHLRHSQGEITRLQQQQASLKPVIDSGYDPQQLQGLINFDRQFQQNPGEVFIGIAKMLQESGVELGELDLEAVIALASGEELPDEAPQTGTPLEGVPESVQQYIAQLEARVNKIDEGIQTQQTRQQELVQDNLLKNQHTRMRTELQKAGYDPESLTTETLNGLLVTHRGNPQAAIQALTDLRTSVLKGFTQQRQPTDPLKPRNGGPQAPRPAVSRRDAGDPFAAARPAATNRLVRANRDRAQG